ncbi:MAG: hypothetical protein FD130_1235 [Halothiobacillaceae bacterium]|nr:MAG: hypothetical protein FD130_1235 [Halothiobacillaceae bacterium]
MSYDDELPSESKSRSQLKRDVEALQRLGEQLIALKPHALDNLPLNDKLRAAIDEAQRLTANGALRRQRQYIGRLMRESDTGPLLIAFDKLKKNDERRTALFHQLERLRDRLLSEGDEAIGDLLERYPQADRAQVRQLTRNAAAESARQQPPKSARQLFTYLRSLAEQDEVEIKQ